ncbi:MAG: acyl--CoA ligase [Pseudomonadota bacterium]
MTESPIRTVRALLGGRAGPALGAPGRADLDYAGLRAIVDGLAGALAGRGIGPGVQVAIVLPNGVEMAVAFLAVASVAVAAPLNPAYTEDEFGFYLDDLDAKWLIVAEGMETSARAAAARAGAEVLEIAANPDAPAGAIHLAGEAAAPTLNGPEETALVLHTSGTTSRPKIVPLTAQNITASAANIAASLALTDRDRCLNVMPLFHIHGLIAAVLSTMEAGGAITCTPGFDALRFFAWMREVRPSWYTAVPTMHQAILSRASRNAETIAEVPLRFIRSSSASLPVPVLEELEATFGCPVVEAYGMTEAAHQMAANPLPPAARKPGTVGIAAGPEVAIMDEGGTLLPQGEIGEIVIRGENVTPGYQNNDKANAEAFSDGWFRTGDQGAIDADGYIAIRGRLKEIINRGGEKVSPREVDDVLAAHPAVAQVVTFALPHPKLGEEVAAAIVLRDGAVAEAGEIRDFAGQSLAAFKVPRHVHFVDEIPKGATGKLQRIGLAEKLGLA